MKSLALGREYFPCIYSGGLGGNSFKGCVVFLLWTGSLVGPLPAAAAAEASASH